MSFHMRFNTDPITGWYRVMPVCRPALAFISILNDIWDAVLNYHLA